ncbi:preprotein translocase subunit SecA [Candidatus Falkowbacteria bacterium CG10_big_fil_rev_8_21_14_0_10_39_11]|uniref:Protein translocase subunit SecA n=1 Tax=Candidatus Falkowbacteria bacterium CG10_big_fil_rev_8_21_14_0_10_39_11 TaxID=1974565 RepID=A0A2H0V538_9BACT|nr:MAG: preprotein translocase subunit SecA [Candidatus Falkowbacteria bacterium CG10_big_fil_rev_8_21_14_0_10_39_11]
MSILTKIFGDPNQKEIDKLQPLVTTINDFEAKISTLSDDELKAKTSYFKQQLKDGKTLDDLLPEAFAVVREVSKRTTGLRHYDVQLVGGIVLHQGQITEMRTGEGKTLVATLAVYLNALEDKGVHVITVNDYLAKRDAVWMGQVYQFLGLSTGIIQGEMKSYIYDEAFRNQEILDEERDEKASYKIEDAYLKPSTRKEAYAADVTYGTNNEFGFDYLRDNMAYRLEDKVQRGLNYTIIDEVDSILIDEARTPLIISAPAEESASLYQKFAAMVPKLVENEDYNIDEKMRAATLSEEGLNHVEKILGMGNIYNEGGIMMVHHLEQALKAHALFKKDRDYVVKEGEVIIIDEFTGRLMVGRRYSEGLHQAIEAKEGVEVKKESRTLATITFQNLFRMYKKLSGMTGTAATEAEEFAEIYNLEVTLIPTNKPIVRQDLPDRVYSSEAGKYKAVIEEIKKIHDSGQPVLIGTVSIQQNETFGRLLKQAGIPHNLLNAKQHENEAEIIAQAGRVGAVTVATNMAGRGVDIILGGAPLDKIESEKVKALGGLFVLGTERHESRRIDNQLRGRSGRQGDPGQTQFYLSMDDDIMRIFGSDRIKNMMQTLGIPEDVPIEKKIITNSIEKAQKRVEGHNFDIRKHLVEYDDVMNRQRETIYTRRDDILRLADENPIELKQIVWEMVESEIEQVVSFHTSQTEGGDFDLNEIVEVSRTVFPVPSDFEANLNSFVAKSKEAEEKFELKSEITNYILNLARESYKDLETRLIETSGEEDVMRKVEKEILFRSIDNLWVEHLDAIQALRAGIGLRGYAQRDPLIEYKKESRHLFIQLENLIQRQVVYSIYKVGLASNLKASVMQGDKNYSAPAKNSNDLTNPFQSQERKESVASKKAYDASGKKVGRNDPCPCGSGKKFKKCHGA